MYHVILLFSSSLPHFWRQRDTKALHVWGERWEEVSLGLALQCRQVTRPSEGKESPGRSQRSLGLLSPPSSYLSTLGPKVSVRYGRYGYLGQETGKAGTVARRGMFPA